MKVELLGAVLLMRMAGANGQSFPVQIRAVHDNQGDVFAVMKAYSKTIPASLVHMELIATARGMGAFPALIHVPREQNVWADALTNHDFAGFMPDKRWNPDLDNDLFYILDELMKARSDKKVGSTRD